mmetsp:Transcript_64010/g.113855  ORF Transcript_64010/g.113855 Transcript_64010/m.113855 type:complete len:174 (-) Transcript_64010:23-544(-)
MEPNDCQLAVVLDFAQLAPDLADLGDIRELVRPTLGDIGDTGDTWDTGALSPRPVSPKPSEACLEDGACGLGPNADGSGISARVAASGFETSVIALSLVCPRDLSSFDLDRERRFSLAAPIEFDRDLATEKAFSDSSGELDALCLVRLPRTGMPGALGTFSLIQNLQDWPDVS